MAGRPARIHFDSEREREELREYLGPAFDRSRLERWEEILEHELAEIGDEGELYRTSQAYLYNLTAFAMSATKLPYILDLTRFVKPPARVLDYGCGIGSDGLMLLEAGYRVEFVDFDNPSARYLRWRLERRGLKAKVHDLDSDSVPAGFDAAFAFDVIEHVDDPFAVLTDLGTRARFVVINFLEPKPHESALHRELPIGDLLDHAARQRLRRYRRYHGRSHLVVYEPGRMRRKPGLRSRTAYWRGRLSAAVGSLGMIAGGAAIART